MELIIYSINSENMSGGVITNDLEFVRDCNSNASSQPCQDYIVKQIEAIKTTALTGKNATMTKTLIDLKRTTDMDANAIRAGIRSGNLLNVQNFIKEHNDSIRNNASHDTDVSRRQYEINEYYYYNKLDTLFFLQVFFISAMTMAIIIYFFRRGTISAKTSGLVTMGLAILVVIIGITRYYYTSRVRDKRLWHRRYFGMEENVQGPDLLSSCAGPSTAATINLNAILNDNTTQCIAESSTIYNGWLDSVNQETQRFMNGSSINLNNAIPGMSVSSSCKK